MTKEIQNLNDKEFARAPRFGFRASSFFRHSSFVIRDLGIPMFLISKDANILPHPHRAEPHVEISEHHPAKARPGPKHVTTIEATGAGISALTKGGAGHLIDHPANQVTQRVAAKGVPPQ